MKKIQFFAMLALIIAFASACGKKGPTGPSFEDLIQEGWDAFAQKDYQTASQKFTDAKAMDAKKIDAYVGLGWSLFKLGQLDQASVEFAKGASESEPTADLYAGWAFTLNAMKQYSLSNVRADQALDLAPNWQFPYGLPLAARNLHVLKAENYFLIGDFQKALQEVQILNPAFTADVNTNDGLAALAQEIETLRAGSTG
ncbi:MAG: hypothetical protein Q9P14_17970 [candidate division KSB1 bacterium]|nr:hypothetical protein [candidate division KSB1 bacterium]MDQ7065196.1 hypothetical protein [candidate division KSB1 bacterium]